MTFNQKTISEVVAILGKNSMGIDGIYEALNDRYHKIGINRLRDILKQATGKELLEDTGLKNKLIYKVNPASQSHGHIDIPSSCEPKTGTNKKAIIDELTRLQPLWEKTKPQKKDQQDV